MDLRSQLLVLPYPKLARRWGCLRFSTRWRGVRCWRTLACGVLGSWLAATSLWGQVSVLTGRNDVSRDGLYSSETYLTTSNVNSATFGNLFSYPVDGYVSAQPLYVPGVNINGTIHNVVYVATEHDSVFAFDADNPGNETPLWQVSVIPAGMQTVSSHITGCTGTNGFTEVGILGTPVIDPSSNTLYVVAKANVPNTDTTSFWLNALDITSGAEKFGAPIEIEASVSSINGTINFNPLSQLQRPALLLSNGTLFIGFGSNGCDLHDHGWLMAYNDSTLQQVGVFNASPDVSAGDAIWMSGSGPAADANGYIYLVTANGDFDVNTGGSDYGDSVVKLQLGSGGLTVADYFTPFDQENMEANDLDLGSGGVMLLPSPQGGTYPDLMVVAGKTGTIYVIDRDNLGQYDVDGDNDDQIPQYIPDATLQEYGTPTYWNNTVYFSAHNDFLKGFSLSNGLLSTTPAESATSYVVNGVPVVSANGTNSGTGIVWIVRQTSGHGQTLDAYNATAAGGILNELYDTSQNSTRDNLGPTGHFISPVIDNGKVYIGTQTQLMVYGLLPAFSVTAGNGQSGTVATTLPLALSVEAADSYLQQPISGVTVTFSDGGKHGTFNPATATTNSSGIATTQYTLPTTAGSITISATNLKYVSASFTETATAGPPNVLTDVSGGFQSATVGTTLAAPLVVKLKDSYGNGVPGVPVAFTDNGANGTFNPPSPVTTSSSGEATVNYTVPTKAQSITITPSYGTLTGNFSEKSVAGAAASVSTVSGNNQVGAPGTQLPIALVAGVKDQYGNPVSGVTVTFAAAAGGSFSTTTPVTNNKGQATVTYTLPNVAGAVDVTATVGGFTANFTETAN
jgi:hypothetical protein